MEWVMTTARTVDEAKDLALEQLGVIADDAEFEVLETPRPGLFGRLRGEARVRARVRPTPVRPKQDRRRGKRGATATTSDGTETEEAGESAPSAGQASETSQSRRTRRPAARAATDTAPTRPAAPGGTAMSLDDTPPADEPPAEGADGDEEVEVDAVRQAAVDFVTGLTDSFGFETTVQTTVEGNEIEVRVDGPSLGVLIGPGGRTLLAIQDLARVAAQRRLGDHETRLRIDVAGYREKRREALERFAATVAEQVRASGVARSLDPMPSADRKILHDALAAIDGVTSRSEGEDPNRRVVVAPG